MKKIYLFSIFLSGFFISINPVLSQTISNLNNNTFTENSSPIVIDSDVTVSGGGGYGGGYILFDLTNGSVGDQLGLLSDADPNVAGAISYSGGNLYLGNGSGKDIIGSIDAILNGQNGQDLKINFTSNFQNSSFEGGLGGWTVGSQWVNLGVTSIAGFISPNDPTYPANSGGDDDVPSSASYNYQITNTQYTNGLYSLRLYSSMWTRYGCDVVHGPYVYSDVFQSSANDVIYFDWRAYAGDDAYDVFGYILNVNTGATTIVLNATGTTSGSTPWATASVTIPSTGTYRFVFVSGTYDATCGQAAGASLYIDNVRVFGDKVNDAVASAIMRKITYQNACGTSDATRNLQVSVRNNLGATGTGSSTIDLITFPPIPPFTSYTTSLSFPSGGSTPLSSWAHLIMPFNDPIPAGAIITGADLTFTAVDQGWGGTGYPAYLFINATHLGDATLFHTSTTNTINYSGQFPDYNYGGVNNLEMGFQGYPGWQAFWQGGTLTIHYKINIGNNNLTVALNNLGSVTITPAQIDPGYTDDCGIVSRTLSKSTFTCSDIGANSVTLTVTDTYGNSASGTSTVTVVDNVPPAALCKNITVYLNFGGTASITAAQVDNGSNDACGIASMSVSPNTFDCSKKGANTVTLTVTDNYNNVSTCTSTVTIADNTSPTLSLCPVNKTQSTDPGNCTAFVTWIPPTVADNCPGVSLTSTHSPGSAFPKGTTLITYTATDASSNFSTYSFTVTVTDNQAPNITNPGNITKNNDPGLCGATVTYATPVGTDNCPGAITTQTAGLASGASYPLGTTINTFKVTDAAGNSTTCSFTVTVLDNEAPVITCPGNITKNNDPGQCGANVTFVATATDNCGVTISYSHQPGNFFPTGSTTVTVTATDPSNNTSTCSFVVKVNDTEFPNISCPFDITINADPGVCGVLVNYETPSATDNCGSGAPPTSLPGYTFKGIHEGHSYFLSNTKVTPDVAHANALATGGHLATANDLGENQFIAGFIADRIWIGFTDRDVEGSWKWITSEPVNYTNWAPYEPNNAGNEDWAVINWSGTNPDWNDWTFGSVAYYAIEFDGGTLPAQLISGLPSGSTFPVGINTITHRVVDPSGNSVECSFHVTVTDNQAPIVLTQNITVQLNASGTASISASQINNGSTDNCGIASMAVTPSSFNCSNVGANTVTLQVTDLNGLVSTGTALVTVQDKVAPVVITRNSTIQLDVSGHAAITAAEVNNGSNDACGIASVSLNKTSFDCSTIGANTVTLTVTDVNGNVSSGTAVVTVEDKVAPVAVAQNVIVQLDATGNGSTTAVLVNNGSNDACGIKSLALSKTAFTCSDILTNPNLVTLTVTDNNNNVSTAAATVTVQDHVAPVAIAQNVIVQLDASGNGSTTAVLVNNGSNDACGIKSLALSKTAFTCSDILTNPNLVTLTVTDNNNNVSTTTATVTVQDNVAPVAVAQNVIVQLDASGNGSTSAVLVNNGSNDACGIKFLALSKTDFTCSDILTNPNLVTLTVTDNNNNASTATATVTVQDNVAPVAVAQNVIVQLDASGNGSTTAELVNFGSNDACGIETLALSKTAFTCSDILTNPNLVTLTVTDNNNNVSTATATVTVQDNVAPVAVAQNVIVQLDASGNGSTSAELVNNGSSDACGIKSLALSKTDFTCSDILTNPNLVTLTVTDNNNNVSTTTATVTVQDNVAPVAIAQNVIVQLDASGNGSTSAELVNNGSSDACGIKSLALSKTDFNCSDILTNPNLVTLTVTDNNNNVSTTTATVIVQDNVAPVAIAQNVIVQLDASGNGSTTAALVNNGSNDACGIKTLALSKTDFTCSDILTNPNLVTLTVTDNNNNVSTATATVTVKDEVPPVITCKNSTSRYIDPYQTYYTVSGAEFDAYATDACGVHSLTYVLSGVTTGTGTSVADIQLNLGANTFVWTAVDVNGNESACTTVVTVLKRPTTLTYSGDLEEQYSDQVDLSATLIDDVSDLGVYGKTINFSIGTQSVTAVTNVDGLATATLILTQSPIPTYTVVTTFVEDDSYLGSSDSDDFNITPEDARVNFTGTHLVATQSSTSGLANVTLRATVQDITAATGDPAYDSFAGDIRNARVKFTIDGTDLSGWLTPTLINSTDLKTGVVSYNWTVDIGNATDEEFTVGIIVNEYYIRNDAADNTVVTVYKPVGDFITGGGYILPTSSAGTYAADPGLKTNFGFNVGYNKSGKNIHGNMNIIFRKTVGGIVHTFQIKANAMTSLGVDISNPAAQVAMFVSKANLKDITNPLAPVSLGGNLTLQVNLTDKGEPGSSDQIAISLYDGSTLLYSSNWTGSATGEILLSGGNLVVHSGFSLIPTKSAEIATATAPVLQYSNLKVYPNPFSDRVRFEFVSPDAVNAQIYIYDMAGRRIETVFEGPVEGGVINKVDFIPRAIANGLYMYRMILGKTVYDGKIDYKK